MLVLQVLFQRIFLLAKAPHLKPARADFLGRMRRLIKNHPLPAPLQLTAECGLRVQMPGEPRTDRADDRHVDRSYTCAVAIPMPRAAPVIKTLSAFDIRKSLTCVAEHFESFIQMTFPISHAD